jgi:MYXO-CTERM domain-containing protein
MIIRSWNWQAKQACRIQQSDLQNKQTSKQNLPMKKTILPLIIGAGMALGTASAPAALLVHFSFDQASIVNGGTITADVGSNGTMVASDANNRAVAGKFGNAISLTATGGADYANLSANVPAIGSKTIGSIAFWFNTTAGFGTFLSGSDASDASSEIRVFPVSAGGSMGFESRNDGTTLFREYTNTGGHNDGEWNHITAVATGTNNLLYLNGVLQTNESVAGSGFFGNVTGLDTLLLGANDDSAGGVEWPYTGLIDELGIWDTALSQAEITALQTNPIPEPAAGALALFALGGAFLLRRRNRR